MALRDIGDFPDIISGIYSPLVHFFRAIGLGNGAYAPILRFGFGFGTVGFLLNMAQPGIMYESGHARPWSIVTEMHESPIQPTLIPWWLVSVFGGIVCGVLI